MTSTGRLLLQPSNQVSIVIASEVMTRLSHHRQTQLHQPESGGLLLGRIFGYGNDCVVEELTEPGYGDRQSRFRFFRSKRHQRMADTYWRRSGEKLTYLGLWHTHPESDPSPSSIDLEDWRRALNAGRYHVDGLLFTIIGTQSIGFWYGDPRRRIKLINRFEVAKHVYNQPQ